MEQLYFFLLGIGWRGILDISLNSYILFRFYVLFRGTNVLRVLLVIVLLWIAKQVAVSLGLIISSWAMQGVITVAALIIIIVFRNELSLILKTKDLKSFFWGIPRHKLKTPASILVESVFELAKKNIGALIVIPREQEIAGLIKGGTSWQGRLSKEMLISIFWPDNPVHDGAAVIQANRVTDVGVILPLSKRDNLPSHYGTRHMAGIGLAEQSDALVLVVSEERGNISLILGNRIHEIKERDHLKRMIEEHTGGSGSDTLAKQQNMELVSAALICLLCVTGLWLTFSRGMETLTTYEIPVEFLNPNQKLDITSSSAGSAKLLLSGARPLINAVSDDQIKIKLNLANASPGINRMAITSENIFLPPGIQLKQIDPAVVDVTVDSIVEKELYVQPNWTGKLPEALVLKQAHPVPETVRVTGRSLILDKITTLFTEPILLEKIHQSGTLTANLVLGSGVRLLNSSQNRTQISYTIEKRVSERP